MQNAPGGSKGFTPPSSHMIYMESPDLHCICGLADALSPSCPSSCCSDSQSFRTSITRSWRPDPLKLNLFVPKGQSTLNMMCPCTVIYLSGVVSNRQQPPAGGPGRLGLWSGGGGQLKTHRSWARIKHCGSSSVMHFLQTPVPTDRNLFSSIYFHP